MIQEEGGRGSIKQRDPSFFKISAVTDNLLDEERRVKEEIEVGLTILEAYDYNFGQGSYDRAMSEIDKLGLKSNRLYKGVIDRVYFPIAEAIERAKAEEKFLKTLISRYSSIE